jgi:hypothetical protein
MSGAVPDQYVVSVPSLSLTTTGQALSFDDKNVNVLILLPYSQHLNHPVRLGLRK